MGPTDCFDVEELSQQYKALQDAVDKASEKLDEAEKNLADFIEENSGILV